jgi:hypothetical protein
MNSLWRTESGQLTCSWVEKGCPQQYNPEWMQGAGTSSSIPNPIPDFASHSPFGGAFWFEPISLARRYE